MPRWYRPPVGARPRPSVVAMLLLVLTPAMALAHVGLRQASPARDATLTAAPAELRLTFTTAVRLPFFRAALLGPRGDTIGLGAPSLVTDSASVVVVPIEGAFVESGQYTVRWQVAGPDGHPVRGAYTFRIAAGAAGLVPTPSPIVSPPAPASLTEAGPVPPETTFSTRSPAYVVLRWLTFLGIIGVLGAVAFRELIARASRAEVDRDLAWRSMRRGAGTLGLWAAGLVVVAAIGRLAAQSYALTGTMLAGTDVLRPLLLQSAWGWGWALQLGGAALAGVGLLIGRRHDGGWHLAEVAAVALAVSPALSGHAVATEPVGLTVVADALHVVGAGGWMGALLMIVAVAVPIALQSPAGEGSRGATIALVVGAFSPLALAFALLLALSGGLSAWLHLGSLSALWTTAYGRTLMLKLALIVGVAAAGAYNWLVVRPRLRDLESVRRIRRTATIELVFGAAVLLVTAALVATPPPAERLAQESVESVDAGR